MRAEVHMETITRSGVHVGRTFTVEGRHPFDEIQWRTLDTVLTDSKGRTVFEQKGVEVPEFWSDTAATIVASKYFHGSGKTREHSVRELISRVAETITLHGIQNGYFQSHQDAGTFEEELMHLLVHQIFAFNSPVWFNVGVHRRDPENRTPNWHWDTAGRQVVREGTGYRNPQCSACFINSVGDTMEDILELAKTEGLLFKYGSGSGSNLSQIRAEGEPLSGGGTASGPLSFMRGFDAFAGVIKSGGKTRRAAKMVILNADHPDIEAFIAAKGKEEAKAFALMREGYDGSGPDSEAYSSIFFQNANHSVRVTDEFMRAVEHDLDWELRARRDGSVTKTVKARALLRRIAEETWRCGDPGIQFDTTINKWHTSKNSGRINASNPCSEYMFLDDSACNLGSLNLVKFLQSDGSFDTVRFAAAVRIAIIAQDILVDLSGYPTEKIARNSHDFRPLGLGYANLGTLLLRMGLPYDSEEGRSVAAAVTAIMGGEAYKTSAELAASLPPIDPAGPHGKLATTGAFPGFAENEEPFREVIAMHLKAAQELRAKHDTQLTRRAEAVWSAVTNPALSWAGFRNAQVTVLAPTGTIGFMMDCDTTGIEPMIGLVVYKKLVGGGFMTLINQSVPQALHALGYTAEQVTAICTHIESTSTIENAPGLRHEHLPIFDSAFPPANGTRSISWKGHIDMMAAVQPFLSGAISKTVNLPNSATVEDIEKAYVYAWKQGLKAVAIYRDGSKGTQVLSTSKEERKEEEKKVEQAPPSKELLNGPPLANRHRLPNERAAVVHKFKIGNYEGYITVGLYPDGQPGELFIRMAKEGSMISGLMDMWATAFSLALQHGVPLKALTSKMVNTSFEPSGWTGTEEFGFAKSIPDYLGRWLQSRFGEGKQLALFNNHAPLAAETGAGMIVPSYVPPVPVEQEQSLTDMAKATRREEPGLADAPLCSSCGGAMRPTGRCWSCTSCGTSNGGCS
ncbi:vitamin B12-dependent ribonucleotide reductase [Pseudacidobacterium ailaaui]|jgi:ribonucleoside-diphosphate reductase alpha chain|uniref:vitamin B12-dependent ribonucleotide reductase n=1 Tax=Pseudacidobacterium ailaaui TaxID=1382359 RepID=UPI00047E0133|nr:vitamin B12-dependent ribonucleotide reductase [Pseudacidobacterium ailaaui]